MVKRANCCYRCWRQPGRDPEENRSKGTSRPPGKPRPDRPEARSGDSIGSGAPRGRRARGGSMTAKFPCMTVMVGFLAASLGGCGQGDGLDRKEVSGTVTFDGKPLPNGSIQFLPGAAVQGVAVSGGGEIE